MSLLKHNAAFVVRQPLIIKPRTIPVVRISQPPKIQSLPRPATIQPATQLRVTKKTPLATFARPVPIPQIKLQRHPKASPISPAPNNSREDADKISKLRGVGAGRVLIIVGNGPSHKEAPLNEFQKCHNIDIMSINKPDDRIWPTQYWLFCDRSQIQRHQKLWDEYNSGIIINSSGIADPKPNKIKISALHKMGFSTNLHTGMNIGRTSIYASMQVALWMGYDHIYIFGCDMNKVNGKLYAWGTNPDVTDDNRMDRFKWEANSYNWMVANMPIDIIQKFTFCTTYNPWEFIKKFENLDHMLAVQTIIDRHSKPQ